MNHSDIIFVSTTGAPASIIDPALLSEVAANLAALDYSRENDNLVHLEHTIAVTREARDRAEARRKEIADLLSPYYGPNGREGFPKFDGQDASAVANALLAGASPTEAAAAKTTQEELERERDALAAAIPDLNRRIQSAEAEIRETKLQAKKRIAPIVAPVTEAIGHQLRTAAETILHCWAALEAIGTATESHNVELRAARTVMPALFADFGLIKRDGMVPVPPELVAALSSLADKGAALPAHAVRTSVHPLYT